MQLFLVIFFVLLNGFFVASEFAIVKVRSTRIAQLSQEGNIRANIANKMLENLDAYLSATQLGITLSSLALGWVGEPFLAETLIPVFNFLHVPTTWVPVLSFFIAFSIISFMHIVIGEIAPKSLAIRKAEATTLMVSYPLHWFFLIFKPAIYTLNKSADLILRLLRIELVPDHQHAHTEEEIRMVVEQSHKGGLIDQTELSLFGNIFDFTNRVGREIMLPRVNMLCLYVNNTFDQNMAIVKKGHFTRFPLCRKDKDDIIGIVHIRDLYEQVIDGNQPNLRKIARPTVLVPETMEIKDILRTLQKNKTEMAIVVDEYGGTSGIITIEDIIEEIVGEIQDEFDNELPEIMKEGKYTTVSAHMLIEEVNDHFGTKIHDEDNDTIGGWIFSQLQEIPQKGTIIEADQFQFIVQEMDRRRITRIMVKPIQKPTDSDQCVNK